MKRFLPVALSAWTIALGLAATPSAQVAIATPSPASHSTPKGDWIISQTFRPPNLGSPPSTAGGATRSGVCFKGNQPFAALLPESQIGLTLSGHPTFFWYLPQSSSPTAQFLLMEQDDSQVVYETSVDLPSRAGVVSFTLPPTVQPLEVGKRYHWYLVINCNPLDRNANPSVEGWVQRTTPSSALAARIEQTAERDLPALYADQGIWYEAVTALARLRRANPSDTRLVTGWETLLKSAGLGTLSTEPLVESLSVSSAVQPSVTR